MTAKKILTSKAGMFSSILARDLTNNVTERLGNQIMTIHAIPGSEDDPHIQKALSNMTRAVANLKKFNESIPK